MITTIYILLILATSSSVNAQSMKKILPNDGAASDIFGFSVSIYQNTAVIGSVQDDGMGSAYIFTLDNTTNQWTQTAKLVASDGAAVDDFGYAVSIYQNTAVIGAPYDDDSGASSGSAYIFTSDNTKQWTQTTKLVASDGAARDFFGQTVSIYQNIAVVGASNDDDMGEDSGSVYIFTLDDTTKQWTQTAKLVASDGATDDRFGASVSIYQNTAAIGSLGDGGQGVHSGLVYIFTFDNTTNQWTETAQLVPNEGAAWDLFGSSVSIYQNTVVIGAEQDDEPDANSGSAYIFTLDNTTSQWTQTAKIVPNDAAAGDWFGQTVSIYQNSAVIGAYGGGKRTGSGSAYLFTLDNTTNQWAQTAKFVASDGAAGDRFGISVSVYQNTTVIGAKFSNDSGTNSGSAYLLNIRNFASCQSVWDQSTEELLFNHAYTYLIQWEMTQCSFTTSPTNNPSSSPSQPPTNNPSQPPTNNPSTSPSEQPTNNPSSAPSEPTKNPSSSPTNNPSSSPTNNPSSSPSEPPTNNPSQPPTNNPSSAPSEPTNNPSQPPTNNPSSSPSEPPTNINNPSSAPCILYGYFSYCFYCFQIIYYLLCI